MLDFLKSKQRKMIVASSSPRWEVEKHLKGAGIEDYFLDIVCGDMVENSKPAPDIYLKASFENGDVSFGILYKTKRPAQSYPDPHRSFIFIKP